MTEDLHSVLASFAPIVVAELKRRGWFGLDDRESIEESAIVASIGLLTWNRILRASKAKNLRCCPEVYRLYSLPGLREGAKAAAEMLSIEPPTIIAEVASTETWVARYYEERGLSLVKTLSRTDAARLKPFIWKYRNYNERDLSRKFKEEGYIFDAKGVRVETIDRTELGRASGYGSWAYAKEAGAQWKRRWEVVPSDGRTRPAHIALFGQVRKIDEAYSNGEMWAKERDINCRGHDELFWEDPRSS